MVKYLPLVGKLLKHNLLLTLILIVEVAMSLFLMHLTTGRIKFHNTVRDSMSHQDFGRSVMVQFPFTSLPRPEEFAMRGKEVQELAEQAQAIPGYQGHSTIQNLGLMVGSTNRTLKVYDEGLIHLFLKDSEAGLLKNKAGEEVIPVVVFSNLMGESAFKEGQELDVGILTGLKEKEEPLKTKVRVVRQVSFPFYFGFGNSYSGLTQPLSEFYNPILPGEEVFIAAKNPLTDRLDPTEANVIFYFKEDAPQDLTSAFRERLNDQGKGSFLKEGLVAEEALIASRIRKDMPFIINFSIIALVGLFSVTFLNMKRFQKQFSIYYLCGCTKSYSFWIYFGYSLGVVVLAWLGFYFYNESIRHLTSIQYEYVIRFSAEQMIWSLLICFGIMILSTLVPYWHLKKQSIISLKEDPS